MEVEKGTNTIHSSSLSMVAHSFAIAPGTHTRRTRKVVYSGQTDKAGGRSRSIYSTHNSMQYTYNSLYWFDCLRSNCFFVWSIASAAMTLFDAPWSSSPTPVAWSAVALALLLQPNDRSRCHIRRCHRYVLLSYRFRLILDYPAQPKIEQKFHSIDGEKKIDWQMLMSLLEATSCLTRRIHQNEIGIFGK